MSPVPVKALVNASGRDTDYWVELVLPGGLALTGFHTEQTMDPLSDAPLGDWRTCDPTHVDAERNMLFGNVGRSAGLADLPPGLRNGLAIAAARFSDMVVSLDRMNDTIDFEARVQTRPSPERPRGPHDVWI